jgi:hypothetical protein
MDMNKIALAAVAGVLAIPAAASAEEYQYVTIDGEIDSITAVNAGAALIAAVDRAPHSGVVLVISNATKIDDDMEVDGILGANQMPLGAVTTSPTMTMNADGSVSQ